MADRDIQGLLVQIEATTAQLRQELQVGEQAVARSSKKMDGDLARVDDAFDRVGDSASVASSVVTRGMAGLAAGAATALAGLVALTVKTVESAKELQIFAQRSNASTTEFQRYAAGAKKVGIEGEALASIFQDVNDRVGDFITTGGGEMADFFTKVGPKVGVTAEQFRKLSGPEALQLFYTSLEKANLSQQEMTFYLESLASDATLLMPLLRNNGKGFKEMGDQAARLGVVLSEIDIQKLSEVDSALDTLKMTAEGASNQLVIGLLPAITEVTENLGNLSDNGAIEVLGQGIGFLLENLNLVAVLAGGAAAASMTRYAATLLESGVAVTKKALATVAATQADVAAAAAAKQKALADQAAALAELERLKTVQAAITAEKALEVQRLKAQISDTGRQISVSRMAELRLAEVGILKQVEAAERSLATATMASQAAASRWAVAGRGVLSLFGGPAGLVALAVSAGIAFLTMRDSTNKNAEALEALKGPLDEVMAKYRQLTADQQRAMKNEWVKEQAESAKDAASEYANLLTMLRSSLIGPRSNAEGIATFRELRTQLDAATATGKPLGDILREAGTKAQVPEKTIQSWENQAGVVSTLTVKQQDYSAKISAVTAEMAKNTVTTQTNTDTKGKTTAAGQQYLKTLQDETQKLKDNGDEVKEANTYLAEHTEIVGEEREEVLKNAAAKKAAREANEKAKKAESEAASASKNLTKHINDQINELTLQASAYAITNRELKLHELAQDGASKKQLEVADGILRELELREDVAKAIKLQVEQTKWLATVNEQLAAVQSSIDLDVLGVGMGDKARQRMEEDIAIRKKYADQRRELVQQTFDSGLSDSNLEEQKVLRDQRISDLNEAEAKELKIVQDGAERKAKAEANWLNGANSAWEDYRDNAANIAAQTNELFSNAFQGMEDALVQFSLTGKLSFKDFATSVIADIVRIQARQAIAGLGSSLLGVAGGALRSLLGGGTAGSNISDYTNVDFTKFVSGQRASGGPTAPDSLYRVNELGPELYSEGGKTFLMSGANGGYVTPLTGSAGAVGGEYATDGSARIVLNAPITVQAQPGMNDQDAMRQGNAISTALETQFGQFLDREMRQGGRLWRR